VIVVLNARLADSVDLMHQAKQVHWHVKGPRFIALHKLFDEVVDAAEDSMDLLAERVVQVKCCAMERRWAASRPVLTGYTV